MAEAAGLALGVLGVTALFSTCVEAFDIVLSAKDCSKEYKQLSALVIPSHCALMNRNFANVRLLAGRSTACAIPDMG